jgi:hypothetical protein
MKIIQKAVFVFIATSILLIQLSVISCNKKDPLQSSSSTSISIQDSLRDTAIFIYDSASFSLKLNKDEAVSSIIWKDEDRNIDQGELSYTFYSEKITDVGGHLINVTVTFDDGFSLSDTAYLGVMLGEPQAKVYGDSIKAINEVFILTADAKDINGNIEEYFWNFDSNKISIYDTLINDSTKVYLDGSDSFNLAPPEASLALRADSLGYYLIRLQVLDNDSLYSFVDSFYLFIGKLEKISLSSQSINLYDSVLVSLRTDVGKTIHSYNSGQAEIQDIAWFMENGDTTRIIDTINPGIPIVSFDTTVIIGFNELEYLKGSNSFYHHHWNIFSKDPVRYFSRIVYLTENSLLDTIYSDTVSITPNQNVNYLKKAEFDFYIHKYHDLATHQFQRFSAIFEDSGKGVDSIYWEFSHNNELIFKASIPVDSLLSIRDTFDIAFTGEGISIVSDTGIISADLLKKGRDTTKIPFYYNAQSSFSIAIYFKDTYNVLSEKDIFDFSISRPEYIEYKDAINHILGDTMDLALMALDYENMSKVVWIYTDSIADSLNGFGYLDSDSFLVLDTIAIDSEMIDSVRLSIPLDDYKFYTDSVMIYAWVHFQDLIPGEEISFLVKSPRMNVKLPENSISLCESGVSLRHRDTVSFCLKHSMELPLEKIIWTVDTGSIMDTVFVDSTFCYAVDSLLQDSLGDSICSMDSAVLDLFLNTPSWVQYGMNLSALIIYDSNYLHNLPSIPAETISYTVLPPTAPSFNVILNTSLNTFYPGDSNKIIFDFKVNDSLTDTITYGFYRISEASSYYAIHHISDTIFFLDTTNLLDTTGLTELSDTLIFPDSLPTEQLDFSFFIFDKDSIYTLKTLQFTWKRELINDEEGVGYSNKSYEYARNYGDTSNVLLNLRPTRTLDSIYWYINGENISDTIVNDSIGIELLFNNKDMLPGFNISAKIRYIDSTETLSVLTDTISYIVTPEEMGLYYINNSFDGSILNKYDTSYLSFNSKGMALDTLMFHLKILDTSASLSYLDSSEIIFDSLGESVDTLEIAWNFGQGPYTLALELIDKDSFFLRDTIEVAVNKIEAVFEKDSTKYFTLFQKARFAVALDTARVLDSIQWIIRYYRDTNLIYDTLPATQSDSLIFDVNSLDYNSYFYVYANVFYIDGFVEAANDWFYLSYLLQPTLSVSEILPSTIHYKYSLQIPISILDTAGSFYSNSSYTFTTDTFKNTGIESLFVSIIEIPDTSENLYEDTILLNGSEEYYDTLNIPFNFKLGTYRLFLKAKKESGVSQSIYSNYIYVKDRENVKSYLYNDTNKVQLISTYLREDTIALELEVNDSLEDEYGIDSVYWWLTDVDSNILWDTTDVLSLAISPYSMDYLPEFYVNCLITYTNAYTVSPTFNNAYGFSGYNKISADADSAIINYWFSGIPSDVVLSEDTSEFVLDFTVLRNDVRAVYISVSEIGNSLNNQLDSIVFDSLVADSAINGIIIWDFTEGYYELKASVINKFDFSSSVIDTVFVRE